MTGQERETCFSVGFRERDYLGLVSFGIFLLVVGMVFVASPNIVSDFSLWIEQMTTAQDLIRPPEGLILGAITFFGLMGASDFFKAAIRLRIARSRRRVLTDMLSGIALVLFAYLIFLYGSHVLRWQMVLAIEAVAVGLLVILYSVIRSALSRKS